ncbi:MAG: histidinol-phosphatase HisJ [Ignavibacteria bacterium]|nr:histidinol-phosphatase HisJ [Ignavibacteria bacterium]
MISDYHTHTVLCKHGEGDVEQYILKAIELGFDEVGCSDHSPMPGNFDPQHRMSLEQYYSIYAPSVLELAEKYKDRIVVKRGIEAEFLPGQEQWVGGFVRENGFDFVIGSVHFVSEDGEEMPLFGREYEGCELEDLYEGYYEAIRASAKSGMFDIIAHVDLIKKFGHRSSKRIDELIREALKAIKASDLCLEINTSGLRKPERETYPGEGILKIAKELRIPLTLGSDAHRPEDVGTDFDVAIALIEQYADGRMSVFTKRQRSEVRISSLPRRL